MPKLPFGLITAAVVYIISGFDKSCYWSYTAPPIRDSRFDYQRTPLPIACMFSASDDGEMSKTLRMKHYLCAEIDPEQSSVPLAAYCFMTGVV